MPFEPRLIGDDADEPLGSLPDDLAALGQQLADDADWLADRYAPGEPVAMPLVGGQRIARPSVNADGVCVFPWAAKAAAAAVVLLAAGILSVNAWRSIDRTHIRIAAPDSIGISTRESVVIGQGADSTWPSDSRIMGFEEFSASQQEAVLDLWEFHQADAPSLSI